MIFAWAFVCLALTSHALAEGTRSITLDWEEIEDISGYQIEITTTSGKKVGTFKSKENSWTGQLEPGKFRLRLRSYDPRGVPGPWSDPEEFGVRAAAPEAVKPKDNTQIAGKDHKEDVVVFEWKTSVGAVKYRLDVFQDDKVVQSEITPNTTVEVKLPVARPYIWTVTAIMDDGKDGDLAKDRHPFTLIGKKLDLPSIVPPENKFVQKLEWNKIEFADRYDYAFQRLEGDKWKLVEKSGSPEPIAKMPLAWPGGRYRLTVRALGNLRQTSDSAKIEFDAADDRSEAALEQFLLREAQAQEKDWQFMASYLLTVMNYASVNPQAGSATSYKAIGGTGRLGIAYFPVGGMYGGQFVADMSGFLIGGQNFRYVSAEGNGVIKYYLGTTQLRVSGGGFYRELPETIGLTASSYSMETIRAAGPHIGFDVLQPLTYRFGIQLNASAYMNALTLSTPNGQSLDPSLSYQVGILGSLRLRPTWIGFAGYAYRVERAAYGASPKSADHPNSQATGSERNTVEISGHYLNLLLEIGF